MKLQLWSYNYPPEPTGIAPVSRTWAEAMRNRSHDVHVVAAHPHYPQPEWGTRLLPYRQRLDGIKVTRLPLWIGRESAGARMRQEASYAMAQTLALPTLGRPEAVVAVSPCFPALGSAILNRKINRIPWILWLQDILPDGAVSTGILEEGKAIRVSRRLERAAYRSADHIVVISERFRENLLAKGVPDCKISVIYNPATRPVADRPRTFEGVESPRILAMGNIGHSQGLPEVVRAFERSDQLAQLGAKLLITGTGVAVKEVRDAITTDRVEMLGVVSDEQLDEELAKATLGLVSQRADFPEFNLPSKLMNYFARGLPVVASVGTASEVAALVTSTEAGVVVNSGGPDLGTVIADALSDQTGLRSSSSNGLRFARTQLTPGALSTRFEEVLAP